MESNTNYIFDSKLSVNEMRIGFLLQWMCAFLCLTGGGAVVEWVRASTGDRTFDGSSPTSVNTFLFGTLAIPFTPLASVFRMRQ